MKSIERTSFSLKALLCIPAGPNDAADEIVVWVRLEGGDVNIKFLCLGCLQ
jgi:hypothetical protein